MFFILLQVVAKGLGWVLYIYVHNYREDEMCVKSKLMETNHYNVEIATIANYKRSI